MSSRSTFGSGKITATYSHYKNVFEAVTNAYTTVKNSHPVVASNPDRDSTSRSRPLTFVGIEYATDVENATTLALKDQPKLQAVWFKLIARETDVDPVETMRTIRMCAKLYEVRGLDPGEYFRKTRRGSSSLRATQ